MLKFVQVFALGTWIGSIMYLSFVVAPGAFATLKDREQAGAMVGYSLSRLHLFGMIVGLLYLVTAFVLVRAVKDLVHPAILGVVLMYVWMAFRPAFFRGEILNRDTPTRVPQDIGTPVGLFGVEREFDVAAHAGVDAVDAVARGQALYHGHDLYGSGVDPV